MLKSQTGSAVIVLSVIIVALLSGIIGWIFFAKSPNPPPKNMANQESDKFFASASPQASTNPMGQDSIIKSDTSKQGPWNNDLYIALSNEGRDYRDSKVFEARSGVPSVIHDKNGKLYAAFQWFPENNPQAFDKVAIKTSTDGGQSWTSPTSAVFKNYPKSFSRPFDPTLVLNSDGKIRMYFTVNKGIKEANTSFYSAISEDGINFTFEEKPRFEIEGTQLVDSAGTVFNNTFFLLAPNQSGGAYFATSTDGLNFTRSSDIASDKNYNWTGNVLNYDNVVRFYGNTKSQGNKIFYAWTTDGINWSVPTPTNISGGDPAVVQALESIYLMIYVGPKSKSNSNSN